MLEVTGDLDVQLHLLNQVVAGKHRSSGTKRHRAVVVQADNAFRSTVTLSSWLCVDLQRPRVFGPEVVGASALTSGPRHRTDDNRKWPPPEASPRCRSFLEVEKSVVMRPTRARVQGREGVRSPDSHKGVCATRLPSMIGCLVV